MSKLGYDLAYARLMVEESANQRAILSSIDEAVYIESGNIAGVQAINESAIDTIKSIIKKFIDKLKGVWAKFIERGTELVTTDKKFLEKYKDTITKNALKNREIDMFEYNEDVIANKYTVPDFDFDKFKQITSTEKVEEEFIKVYFPNLKSDQPLKEQVIAEMKGTEEKTIKSATLNPTAMYTFCANYKATMDKIKKDYDTIIGMQSKMEQKLATMVGAVNTSIENSKGTNTPADTPKETPKEEAKNESVVYSNLLESYITELKVGKAEETETSAPKGGSDGKAKGIAKVSTGVNANNNVDSSVNNDKMDSYKGNVDVSDDQKSTELAQMQKGLTTYFTCAANLLLAKSECSMSMYKDYMKILKIHVRDYTGTDTTANSNTSVNVPETKFNMSITVGDKTGKLLYNPKTASGVIDGSNVKVGTKEYTLGAAANNEIAKGADSFAKKIKLEGDGVVVRVKIDGGDYLIIRSGGWKLLTTKK